MKRKPPSTVSLAALCGIVVAITVYGTALVGAVLTRGASASSVPAQDFAAQATVLVSDDLGHGSGVVIARGLVLTAAHVVGQKDKMKVTLATGVEKDAAVLWASKNPDVALLAVATDDVIPAVISCAQPTRGESVFTFGYPMIAKKVMAWGHVASNVLFSADGITGTMLDMTIVPGNSGGGVWDEQGHLVGLADAVMLVPIGFTPSITGLSVMVPGPAICKVLGRVA